MVHKLLGGVRDVEHALHPVEVGALLAEEHADPVLDEREVDLAVLEDDVDETLRLANLCVDELDDVILPAKRLEQSNLIHEPRDGLLLAALQTDALERVRLALGAEHLVPCSRSAHLG